MTQKDYLQDITEIRSIMTKSTRFVTLSGLSGILAGIYALIGVFVGRSLIISYQNGISDVGLLPITYFEIILVAIALIVLMASVLTAFFLTRRKAKKNNENIWSSTSRRLLKHFLIPLIVGGLFCIVLYQFNLIGLIAPCSLIFYGLACINASNYTVGSVFYLGIANIIIGLIATQFIGYGLYFWALGFGIFHIVYGILMYNKHD